MPIDNLTANFGWELPDASNQLSTDVLRLIDAITAIDAAMALRPTDSTVDAKISTAVAGLVASSPAALDTLNELAAALGNDANFATTMTTALGNKLGLGGGILTGLLTLAEAGLQLSAGADPDVDGKLALVSGALKYQRGGTVYELADSGSAQTLVNKTFTAPTVNGGTFSGIAAASTIKDGANTNQKIGYLGVPAKAAWTGPGAYTLVLADAFLEVPTNQAVVIPDNASVAFPVGTMVAVRNTAAGTIGISIGGTDSLILEGTTNTGARTLAQNGVALLKKVGTTSWLVIGGSVV